jgi:hypothetical protein
MPVVIKELIIKAQVDAVPQVAKRPAQAPADRANIDKDALLRECVESVLEVLRQKGER